MYTFQMLAYIRENAAKMNIVKGRDAELVKSPNAEIPTI